MSRVCVYMYVHAHMYVQVVQVSQHSIVRSGMIVHVHVHILAFCFKLDTMDGWVTGNLNAIHSTTELQCTCV